jgi:hypothetical protein
MKPAGISGIKEGISEMQNYGDLFADSHNILNMQNNYFPQLLNVHKVSDVRQIEVHTYEVLVPESSPSKVEILFRVRKNCLISGRSLLLCQFTRRGNKTDCSNYRRI